MDGGDDAECLRCASVKVFDINPIYVESLLLVFSHWDARVNLNFGHLSLCLPSFGLNLATLMLSTLVRTGHLNLLAIRWVTCLIHHSAITWLTHFCLTLHHTPPPQAGLDDQLKAVQQSFQPPSSLHFHLL